MSEINVRQVILGVLTVAISLVLLVVAVTRHYPSGSAGISPTDEAGQMLDVELGVSSEMGPTADMPS
ncbi:hypothetical protein [Cyanobium sp. NIES-981]|uniref:hypothetical protein n=1 Tax=Cyanobium sp. NIES-981 TaxID=1851505 RepID=UPI0007DDFAC1|nr:hypothetical protein [Cyanobium sp. NIES-981]SBO41984.1 protein of unknown function [Cyanobium sp. NIES-981]